MPSVCGSLICKESLSFFLARPFHCPATSAQTRHVPARPGNRGCARHTRALGHRAVVARNRNSAGAALLRPHYVFVHLLALLQSPALHFFLCHLSSLASVLHFSANCCWL